MRNTCKSGGKENGRIRNGAASVSSSPLQSCCHVTCQAWHVTSMARLKPSACCQHDALRHCFWPPYRSQQFCKRCRLAQMSQALGCHLAESLPCKICLHLGWQHSMSLAGKVDSRGLGECEMEETVVWERLKQDKRFENTVSLCQLTTSLGLSSFPLGSQTCMPNLGRSVLPPCVSHSSAVSSCQHLQVEKGEQSVCLPPSWRGRLVALLVRFWLQRQHSSLKWVYHKKPEESM